MKQILSLILALALTAALFTGCGCAANVSTHPGGMITEESTRPSIMPHPTATHETTRPTEPKATTLPRPTQETGDSTRPTTDTIPGSTGETSAATDATTEQRARNRNTMR